MSTTPAIVIRRTVNKVEQLTNSSNNPSELENGQWGFATESGTLVIRDLQGNFHYIKTELAMLDSILVKEPVLLTTNLPNDDQTGTLRMVLNDNSYWFKTDSTWVNLSDELFKQATNDSLGVVKGSEENMKVSVDGLGEMSVNGLQSALDSKLSAAGDPLQLFHGDGSLTPGFAEFMHTMNGIYADFPLIPDAIGYLAFITSDKLKVGILAITGTCRNDLLVHYGDRTSVNSPFTAYRKNNENLWQMIAKNYKLEEHTKDISNPHSVTKSQVGLGSVDNLQQATKTEFNTHNADNVRHIIASERTAWNGKQNGLNRTITLTNKVIGAVTDIGNSLSISTNLNIAPSDIPNLDASKITSGTLGIDRMPNLTWKEVAITKSNYVTNLYNTKLVVNEKIKLGLLNIDINILSNVPSSAHLIMWDGYGAIANSYGSIFDGLRSLQIFVGYSGIGSNDRNNSLRFLDNVNTSGRYRGQILFIFS
jgi:hypothetical protein